MVEDDATLTFLREFVIEATEHLEHVDEELLALEEHPDDAGRVNTIFRAVHSIKGAASMLDLSTISDLSHAAETLLGKVRDGKIACSHQIIEALLKSCDLLRSLVAELFAKIEKGELPGTLGDATRLLDAIQQLEHLSTNTPPPSASTPASRGASKREYEITDETIQDFGLDARHHLDLVDVAIASLQEERQDREAIHAIFRSIHTVKSGAGYIGYEALESLAHEFEHLLSLLRDTEPFQISDETLALLRDTVAVLREMVVHRVENGPNVDPMPIHKRLMEAKQRMGGERDTTLLVAKRTTAKADSANIFLECAKQHLDTVRRAIREADAAPDPATALPVDGIFRSLHSLKSAARYMNYSEIEETTILLEDVAEDLRSGQISYGAGIRDFLLENLQIIEKFIATLAESQAHPPPPRPAAAPPPCEEAGEAKGETKTVGGPPTMRVEQAVLDEFMSLVGELTVTRNSFGHIHQRLTESKSRTDALRDLRQVFYVVTRISEGLLQNVMRLRAVPMRNIFQKLNRVVRDTAKMTGKKVEFITEGGEVEIDKSIAEQISDPLLHIVRNSVDHGIEPPHVRLDANKKETGTVTLRASRIENTITIEVIDDGGGIDPAKIGAKAVKMGLATEEELGRMKKEEILQFIFAPGFSTAEKITNISGRGVGMDVVRTNIRQLNGKIALDSEVGRGTRIRIDLPLTMTVSILETLLVESEERVYAIPIKYIRETVKLSREQIRTVMGEMVTNLRGEVVGLRELASLLQPEVERGVIDLETPRPALILEVGSACLGIFVDKILTKQEIVAQPLPDYLAGLPGLAGASVLGDGRVILILDASQLVVLGTSGARRNVA